jgi:hypothetical protein
VVKILIFSWHLPPALRKGYYNGTLRIAGKANYFNFQESTDPQIGKPDSIIKRQDIVLLIKAAVYIFIYQYSFLLEMITNPAIMSEFVKYS